MATDNSKIGCILMIYEQFRSGKAVNKAEAAGHYGVSERYIQRGSDTLRAFFSERAVQAAPTVDII